MSHPQLSEQHIKRIIFVFMTLFPLVGMAIDLISPSLPAMSNSLHISNSFVKNLISFYLIGFAFGNFFIGFLCDAWGRRYLLLIGLAGFTVASLVAPLFPQPLILLLARFLQGLFVAALAVISRGVMADIVPHEKLVHTGAALATMWGIGPIIGPLIGGYLQVYFGWKACFYFFALYSFAGFTALFFMLPETHVNRQALSVNQIVTNLRTLLSSKLFIGIIMIMGSSYALLIAFNTLGPFFIQSVLGKSPIFFGHAALVIGCIYLVTTIVCRRLLKQITPEKLFSFVAPISLSLIILATILAYFNQFNLVLLLVTTCCMFSTCGFIYPAGLGRILSLFRPIAGSAAAMMN